MMTNIARVLLLKAIDPPILVGNREGKGCTQVWYVLSPDLPAFGPYS